MRKTNPDTERMMKALGCAIRSECKVSFLDCDPEKQLLKSLKYYWQNNSVFFLVYTSLVNRIYPYIHVDRLVKLAKNSLLSNDELCLLIAVCNNLSEKDRRFKMVMNKLYRSKLKMESPPENESDKYLISEWGEELSLKKFGVSVRSFYIEKNAKLFSLKTTFELNPWLKYRALFGSNTRADAAYIILNSVNDIHASEVSRIISSTRQAVGKYYKDLKLIRNEKLNFKI